MPLGQLFTRRITIARIYDIPVRIDYRWFAVVALSVWLISSNLQGNVIHLGNVRLPPLDPATAWLLACGPLTATPLMLFAWAARRIPLSFMGFLQFMGPTIGFFIGISQGEDFTPVRAASFVFIWAGAAVYAWGAWRRSRMVQPQP